MLNRTDRARLAPKSTNPRTAVPVIVFDGVAHVVVVSCSADLKECERRRVCWKVWDQRLQVLCVHASGNSVNGIERFRIRLLAVR